jgi:arylsulfatase A-like enzyme
LFWRYRRGVNTRKAVRDGRWKLTSDNGEEALFDLRQDPLEQRPLQEREAATADSLRAKLKAWEGRFRPRRLG